MGVGGGSSGGRGGGDRLLRAQVVIALALGFTILAVVLYLMRRPAKDGAGSDEARPDAAPSASAPSGVVRTKLEEPKGQKKQERVTLGAPQRVRCGASPKRGNEGSLCDSLPFFEQALAKAIQETVDCAPKTGKAGTINYVLSIDFNQRTRNVFAGQSGAWKGPQARRAAECVERALPTPQWESVPHQYRHYQIAILATYPPPDPLDTLPQLP